MRILKTPEPVSVQIEIDYDELCGLLKIIGSQSTHSRIMEFGLTEQQSEAISDMFMKLSDFVPQEDR